MNYGAIKINIVAMLNEPDIEKNREFVSTLCILFKLVDEEEAYHKKVAKLMGEEWEERIMNERK